MFIEQIFTSIAMTVPPVWTPTGILRYVGWEQAEIRYLHTVLSGERTCVGHLCTNAERGKGRMVVVH